MRYADTGVYSGSWVTVGCPQAGFGLVCTNLATPGHQNMQWRINRIECGQNHPTASRQHILRQAIFCYFDWVLSRGKLCLFAPSSLHKGFLAVLRVWVQARIHS